MADEKVPKHSYEEGSDESTLISIYTAYKNQSKAASLSRLQQNKVNYDSYHMRQDFSYKQKGQSQEFLPKLSLAVESGANSLQAGLVDMGEWFRVYPAMGLTEDNMKIKPFEIQKLAIWQLEKAGFLGQMNDGIKLGFLGSLMIAKIHGKFLPKSKFEVITKMEGGSYKRKLVKKDDQKWQLVIDFIRQQDWMPDPTGANLFKIQDSYVDWHVLDKMAKDKNSGYMQSAVDQIKVSGVGSNPLQEYEKSRETGQNVNNINYRRTVKVTEMWGNFVNNDGELVWENCQAVIANDLTVLMKPRPIKFWHGEDPYVSTPILRVPHSVWGKTPMDAAATLNIATNEMFNLILDGGLAAVHGIKQVREHWLEDTSQLEDGLPPGTVLKVNTSCPPGMTAFERVDTTTIPAEVLPVYNILVQEFTTAAMTEDLRTGVDPDRQVKATALVQNSQANNSMFSSIAKHIEADLIKPLLYKSILTIAQHLDQVDEKELESVLGQKRAQEILAMGSEGLFAELAGQIRFEVFGISETLNKQKEFTKLQAMLQTIAASPLLMEQFNAKYDFGKLLTEIMRSLDVPLYKIMNDEILNANPTAQPPQQQGGQPAQPGPPGQVPNAQSQIPQAGAAVNQASSPFPQPNLPGSVALQAEGK